jgi:hypothetical protein
LFVPFAVAFAYHKVTQSLHKKEANLQQPDNLLLGRNFINRAALIPTDTVQTRQERKKFYRGAGLTCS